MTKLYAQEKRVFDINKVTIVGSPAITSDGVASGFDSGQIYSTVNLGDAKIIKIFMRGQYYQGANFSTLFWFATNENRSNIVRLGIGASGDVVVFASGVVCRVNKSSLKPINNEWLEFIVTIDTTLTTNNIKLEVIKNKTSYESVGTYTIINPKALNILYWGTSASGIEYSYGSIDLNSFKIYVDGALVYSPTKPTYLLERRKPKVWNKGQFTIVGNPSISDSGVASGFSDNNYLKRVQTFDFNKPFIIKAEFITGEPDNTEHCLFHFNNLNSFTFRIHSDNRFILYFPASTMQGFRFGSTALPNTKYFLEIEYDLTKLTAKLGLSKDNMQTFTEITNADFSLTQSYSFLVGITLSLNRYWKGSIDLKQFKIYTDNNLVFDGGAETYVYDPSKFTVVGSPTITDYGVASGFSGSNYLTVTTFNPNTSTWKIKGSFKTPTTLTQVSQKIFGSTKIYDGVNLGTYNNVVQLAVSNTGSSMNIADITSTLTILPNTLYYYEVVFDGASYKVNLSTDNKNWITYINKATNLTVNSFTIQMGAFRNGLAPWLGSINLSQFSITVDGKEVFTGAKEKFYAMRGM